MRIPRYWARAEGATPSDYEGVRQISVWGWSGESQGDAERDARVRLTELLDRARQGLDPFAGYAYSVRLRREEILDELHNDDGRVEGFLSRTTYGSVVLNAARVMFVDVDVPWPTFRRRIARLLGSRAPSPEALVLARVRSALEKDSPRGSYRIYRTAAGLRILATDPLFAPGSAESERLMGALGADPAFIQLCRVQKSFRARLTPKPWRCGLPNPPGRFPRERTDQDAFDSWVAEYERSAERRATCQLIEEVGWGRLQDAAAALVDLHDKYTKASSDLPLA